MNMEGLIIGFIVMALAALFNQKKAPDESGESTNSPQTTRQGTRKRAEDYAKEIYGDLQTQMKQHPEKTKQITRKVQETIERSPVAQKAQEAANRSPVARKVQETVSNSSLMDTSYEISAQEPIGRLGSTSSRIGSGTKTASNTDSMFPLKKEDLKKSIILSEILMPPKSKR